LEIIDGINRKYLGEIVDGAAEKRDRPIHQTIVLEMEPTILPMLNLVGQSHAAKLTVKKAQKVLFLA
jgi:hypothetical protein